MLLWGGWWFGIPRIPMKRIGILKGTMIKSQKTNPNPNKQLTIGWSNWKVFSQTNKSKLVSCLNGKKPWKCYSKKQRTSNFRLLGDENSIYTWTCRMSRKLSTYQVKIQKLEVGWLLEQLLKVFVYECWGIYSEYCIGKEQIALSKNICLTREATPIR